MCLYKAANKHLIAPKGGIICYKIAEQDTYGELYSYYMQDPITLGEPMEPYDNFSTVEDMDFRSSLTCEVVHAFAQNKFDKDFVSGLKELTKYYCQQNACIGEGKRKVVLIECKIPEGTIYYKNVITGGIQGKYPQYGALKLIPIEKVSFNIVSERLIRK